MNGNWRIAHHCIIRASPEYFSSGLVVQVSVTYANWINQDSVWLEGMANASHHFLAPSGLGGKQVSGAACLDDGSELSGHVIILGSGDLLSFSVVAIGNWHLAPGISSLLISHSSDSENANPSLPSFPPFT